MKTKLYILVFLISVCSLPGMAQKARIYTGEVVPYAIYCQSYQNQPHVPYFVHAISTSGLDGTQYADQIFFLENNNTKQYQSSHGLYVSFKYCVYTYDGNLSRYPATKQMVLVRPYVHVTKQYYAFVNQGNHLYLVNLYSDEIVGDLGEVVNGDLSIMVCGKSGEESFYIINNGWVNVYAWNSISNAIKSRPADELKSEKAYNMSGMEVDPSNERLFIQDGKVKMNTK